MIQYESMNAHRAAFYFWYGYLPKIGMVCHRCDNPKCCNPHHLYHGNAKTNRADAERNGKIRPRKPMKGEDAPNAKLTEQDVIRIRKIYFKISRPERTALAKQFGITMQHILRVAKRKNWIHL